MLTFIYGNDTHKRTKARDATLRSFAGGQIISRSDIDVSADELAMLIGSASLFDDKIAVVYLNALENTEFGAQVLPRLPDLAGSANQFVFIERECSKDIEKAFIAAGAVMIPCQAAVTKKSFEPTIFSLVDAFAVRDRKQAWALYQKELEKETAPEEVLGVLWWSVKNMLLLSGGTLSEKDSGMKSYTYNKTRAQAKNFTFEELRSMGAALVRLSHDGHSGEVDMREGLELFLLGGK